MRTSIALGLLVAFLMFGRGVREGDETLPRGRLLAVGGGGTPEAVGARALVLAGGAAAHVLIVPQASSEPVESGASSAEYWKERGAEDVRVLDLADRARALADLEWASFVWMTGGDQNRLTAALREAQVIDAIRARYRAGALVGGTSAGAAVLSGAMIVGGESADLTSVRAGGTKLDEGLGLWDGAIVDQHFLQRQRFNRLLAAVLDRPALVGLGVDEKTGLFLHPDGSCEVAGDGAVLVLDARAAQVGSAEQGGLHGASGVVLSLHRAGERFTVRAEKPR